MYKDNDMKRIGLSAGHYPEKSGAVHNELIEHELILEWIDRIFDVYDDTYDFDSQEPGFDLVPIPVGRLTEKVRFINNHDFDYVIELHFNSVGGRIVSGSETLYMPGSNRGFEFATIVQENIAPALQIRDRGIKEGVYWGSRERTLTPLYFLRRTNCPAIIIEPEFLQSYNKTMTDEVIEDFSRAFINALDEVVRLNI